MPTLSLSDAAPLSPLSVVLDTNVLLDVWLFDDARFEGLTHLMAHQQMRWLSTAAMREEFRRVLDYAHLALKRESRGLSVQDLLDHFDRHAVLCEPAPKAPYVCKDPDDQKFIDLAVAHQAVLYSKDKCVLALKNRLARLGIEVRQRHVV
jgi:putative PIN family toxin of toxin-antitoxin system